MGCCGGHRGYHGVRCQLLFLPQLIKSLKKAIEPAISDITIDWYVPDSMEALLSPTELPALYPGDRLVSYCVLYSIARFRNRRPPVRLASPSGMGRTHVPGAANFSPCQGGDGNASLPQGREGAHRGSRSSALPSQEEMPSPGESRPPPRSTPGSRDASLELSTGGTEASERSEWGGGEGGGQVWSHRLMGHALAGQVRILFRGETSGSGFTSPPTSRSSMS